MSRKTHINIALRTAIASTGRKAYTIAKLAGLTPDRLSKITNGHKPATDRERQRLAQVLGKSERELFDEVAA